MSKLHTYEGLGAAQGVVPLTSAVCAGTGRKRRVMFEYVMLRGVNDSHEDAVELARIASSMPTHVNLM